MRSHKDPNDSKETTGSAGRLFAVPVSTRYQNQGPLPVAVSVGVCVSVAFGR